MVDALSRWTVAGTVEPCHRGHLPTNAIGRSPVRRGCCCWALPHGDTKPWRLLFRLDPLFTWQSLLRSFDDFRREIVMATSLMLFRRDCCISENVTWLNLCTVPIGECETYGCHSNHAIKTTDRKLHTRQSEANDNHSIYAGVSARLPGSIEQPREAQK